MDQRQAEEIFKKSGAFLQGHFLLTSGLHSPGYLQCALVCQDPAVCAQLCAELAKPFRGAGVNAVIGPAMGGIVLAYEMARALGVRGLFTERDENGRMVLRRGFALERGEKVLVAEDVMTTGGSAAELIEVAAAAGVEVVGVVALVDRGGAARFEGRRVAYALKVELPTYQPAECPLCRQGAQLTKPGSRKRPGT